MTSPDKASEIINYLIDNHTCYVMMIGIMGSGKSEFIEKYLPGYSVVNMGDIRKDIESSPNHDELLTGTNLYNKSTEVAQERCINILKQGYSVIYDAANCYSKVRNAHLKEVDPYCDLKIGVIINRSLVSSIRNLNNTRISDNKMENMYYELKKKSPNMIDGFDILISVDMSD